VRSSASSLYMQVSDAQRMWRSSADYHVAALCADTDDRQNETLRVLEQVLSVSNFPSRSILDDIVKVWRGAQ
jgi:hypothetical protein